MPNFGDSTGAATPQPPAAPMQAVADLAKKEAPGVSSQAAAGAKILDAIDQFSKTGNLTPAQLSALAQARDKIEAVIRLVSAKPTAPTAQPENAPPPPGPGPMPMPMAAGKGA